MGSVVVEEASGAAAPRGVGKMINAETFFTAEEQQRIRQAVVTAEQRTAGEIVPMLVGASARYAEIEIAGMGVGLVAGPSRRSLFKTLGQPSIHNYSGLSRARHWDLSSAHFQL